jgi:endonuclease/exonuclease/phosphatase family metal-dependent hydrolase
MKTKPLATLFLLLLSPFVIKNDLFSQSDANNITERSKPLGTAIDLPDSIERFRIMFYNTENLFDPFDDSLTNDDEFTPEGSRHWTYKKFFHKLNNISKVIIGIGEWNPPAIIGLCEIENRFVLNKLIYETPLKNFGYRIIHFESPDRRGIDVGLLYRQDVFLPLHCHPVSVCFPDYPDSKTRDILYVKGVVGKYDTLHFFINHWSSRLGGYEESKPKRLFTASVLRNVVDSLFIADTNPKVVIMGDFNDEPWDESIQSVLKAKTGLSQWCDTCLFDMMGSYKRNAVLGTNKYREDWSIIDQIILSGNLLDSDHSLHASSDSAYIYAPGFLLEEDKVHFGKQPFRTYDGFKYSGGFSDHLPVFIDLVRK